MSALRKAGVAFLFGLGFLPIALVMAFTSNVEPPDPGCTLWHPVVVVTNQLDFGGHDTSLSYQIVSVCDHRPLVVTTPQPYLYNTTDTPGPGTP